MSKIMTDLPEIVETQNLILQMPKAGFGEKLHAAMADGFEDYVKWLNWRAELPSPQAIEEECRKHMAEFILRDCIRYLLIDQSTHDVVGRCALPSFQANWAIPQFGISYFVRKSQRLKGYATEAAHVMCLLAFDVLKARKIEIYSDAENTASAKIPVKLGFSLEYVQKGGWPRSDGTLAELHTYSIFSRDALIAPNKLIKSQRSS